MKEKIQKLAQDLATAVTLLKEEKTEEAVAALETAAEGVAELTADATATEESIAAKDAEIVEKSAKIEKYASLNISTDNIETMMEELCCIKDMMTATTTAVDTMTKTASTKEDIAAIDARLETIEKARVARQISDEQRQSMEKSAITGLNLSPSA